MANLRCYFFSFQHKNITVIWLSVKHIENVKRLMAMLMPYRTVQKRLKSHFHLSIFDPFNGIFH